MPRDSMEYDIVIVGAGPAGLAAAIRIKQLAQQTAREISVCVLEKSSAIGAHILSGAIIDPIALNELLPDWQELGLPVFSSVKQSQWWMLGETRALSVPHVLLPPALCDKEAYIVSLGQVCQWLGEYAESLGVEIYPGFAAAEILWGDKGEVRGVISGDMGRDKHAEEKPDFTPGIELIAKYTLFAEGARGSLTKQLEKHFSLRKDAEPAKFGLGFKEIWKVKPEHFEQGKVIHTLGWPLTQDVGGGGFIYHQDENHVAVGFVVHLDYANPTLSPFEEFQRFKTHPKLTKLLGGGERLAYGARAITEGGLQSLPQLTFAGGALLGCAAGMVNVPRIKGSHNAIKSGILAAEAACEALAQHRANDALTAYQDNFNRSWVYKELDQVRNIKPALSRFGTWGGMMYAGVELWLASVGVRLPWTFTHDKSDAESLDRIPHPSIEQYPLKHYPKPDGVLTFDKLSSIALCNISHDENQPNHLRLLDEQVPTLINLSLYAGPEARYCPAGVYEFLGEGDSTYLQINAQNCIHCKTCDIKDPTQNIVWVTPEGGSGPTYVKM